MNDWTNGWRVRQAASRRSTSYDKRQVLHTLPKGNVRCRSRNTWMGTRVVHICTAILHMRGSARDHSRDQAFTSYVKSVHEHQLTTLCRIVLCPDVPLARISSIVSLCSWMPCFINVVREVSSPSPTPPPPPFPPPLATPKNPFRNSQPGG